MSLLARYFIRDILKVTWIITGVLLLIFLSYLVKGYFDQLSLGLLTPAILFQLILFQLPLLLATVLPLGLYLGILIVYRQLDFNNERLAAFANGLSYARLTGITLLSAIGVVFIVGTIMLWLKPHLYWAERQLLVHRYNPLQSIKPGRFTWLQNGKMVIYPYHISSSGQLQGLFVAYLPSAITTSSSPSRLPWEVITAQQAYKSSSAQSPSGQAVTFKQGYRYKITPGKKTAEAIQYKEYSQALPDLTTDKKEVVLGHSQRIKYLPTSRLWTMAANDLLAAAELQWRLSLPLSVILLALLAIPLSYNKPKQKRSVKWIVAILLYIGYVDTLLLGRAWMKKGLLSGLGLWWIHGAMVMLLLILYYAYFSRGFKRRHQ